MPLNPNPSNLDQQQIIQRAFDALTDSLRTTTNVTATISGDVVVEIDAATGDNIALANADGSKKVDVQTVLGVNALSVSVENQIESTPVGLSKDIRQQRIPVTEVATKIPGTPLTDRNSMSVRVLGAATVYFGDATVTALNGYPKVTMEEMMLDIRDNATVELYGICEAGKTSSVAVIELA